MYICRYALQLRPLDTSTMLPLHSMMRRVRDGRKYFTSPPTLPSTVAFANRGDYALSEAMMFLQMEFEARCDLCFDTVLLILLDFLCKARYFIELCQRLGMSCVREEPYRFSRTHWQGSNQLCPPSCIGSPVNCLHQGLKSHGGNRCGCRCGPCDFVQD